MKLPGDLAPVLQSFFAERLAHQLGASPHTIASYRDTLRLLLEFAQRELRTAPARLCFADLDAPVVARFLEHLERGRGNTARTRNTRLAAIHSLYRFAALKVPSESQTIQRSSRFRTSASSGGKWISSRRTRLMSSLLPRISQPQAGDATKPFRWSPSKRACASPS